MPSESKKNLCNISVIVLLTCIVYSFVFGNQFLFDDYSLIHDWPLIQDWRNLPRFFISYVPPAEHSFSYTPLKTFFHFLSYQSWGVNPIGYHAFGLVVHCSVTVLLYWLTVFLTQRVRLAFWAGLLFGLHPVHVEPVVHMSQSIGLMGYIFYLLSFYSYARNSDDGLFKKGLPVLFAAAAMLTNEMCLSLPVIILLYEMFFPEPRAPVKAVIEKVLPFFTLAGIYFLLKIWAFGGLTNEPYLFGSWYLTFLVMIKSAVKYVFVSFFPFTLAYNHVIAEGIFSRIPGDFDRYSVLTQTIFDPATFFSLISLALILLAVSSDHQRPRIFLFCAAWFFSGLLPALQIIPNGVFFSESYLYLPSFGACLAIAYFLSRLSGMTWTGKFGRKAAFVLLLFIIIAFSGRTALRIRDWKDPVSFLTKEVQMHSQIPSLNHDLGVVHMYAQNYSEAVKYFQRAIFLKPSNAKYCFSLAEAEMRLGDLPRAVSYLKKAIDLKPDYKEAYFNLAAVYANLKMPRESEEALFKAGELYQKDGKILEGGELIQQYHNYFTIGDLLVDQMNEISSEQ